MATRKGGVQPIRLATLLGAVGDMLDHLAPARMEERRRVAEREAQDEDYLTRHLIHRTLDTQAALRRLAAESPSAARRYGELVALELASLEELEAKLAESEGEPEVDAVLAEARAELAQLRTEAAWCRALVARM